MLLTAGGGWREWVVWTGIGKRKIHRRSSLNRRRGFRPRQQASLTTILPNIVLGINDDVWSVQGGRLLQVMGRAEC
jgi:hypothetical protein